MNKKVIIGIVVIIAVGIGIYGYMQIGMHSTTQTPAEPNTIVIQNFAFGPETLTVKAGTTITWINKDFIGHDVVGDGFKSPHMSQGDKFTFTFTTPGTYTYLCDIHPIMKGKIVVQ